MPKKPGDPRGTHAYQQLRAALRRQQLPCALCRQPIDYTADARRDPLAFTVDHIIPIRDGGTNARENCRPVHRACNQARNRKRQASAAEQRANAGRRRRFGGKSRDW